MNLAVMIRIFYGVDYEIRILPGILEILHDAKKTGKSYKIRGLYVLARSTIIRHASLASQNLHLKFEL